MGKIAADTRNPFIAGALEIMINTENRFSGIPTIYREMKRAGLREPVFENKRGIFKVIFYNGSITEQNVKEITGNDHDLNARIIAFCKTPKSREDLANEFDFDSPYYMITRYIRPLVEEGKLHMTIPEKPKSKMQRYYS